MPLPGKVYYYNAATRATQWTKPEGPDVKILTQEEVEKLQKKVGGAGGDGDKQSAPGTAAATGGNTDSGPTVGEAKGPGVPGGGPSVRGASSEPDSPGARSGPGGPGILPTGTFLPTFLYPLFLPFFIVFFSQ
jgi:hypothetical protein